jgi:hypothetical protein
MFEDMKAKVCGVVAGIGGVFAVPAIAMAEGVADTAVTTAMQEISGDVVATMGAVAPYGLAVLAIFLGFRYGKRIFTSLARG